MKKFLMKFLFTLVAVVGLTLSVSAQKNNDEKKRPPKDPVKIPAPDKNKPRENPKGNDKGPKKPGMAYMLVVESTEPQTAEGQ